MESLKLLRRGLFLVLSVFIFIQSYSQNKINDAFKASYQLESRKEYAKAAEVLKPVYDEKSYEINLRLGWLCYLAGSNSDAVTYYRKAMELKPYAIEPCLGFALPASILGRWKEIEETYDRALAVDPNNSILCYRKGLILYNRNGFQEAEKYFEKVVNLYPFDYDGLHMLAWTKLKLQKTGEARILFQKALLCHPDSQSDLEGLKMIK